MDCSMTNPISSLFRATQPLIAVQVYRQRDCQPGTMLNNLPHHLLCARAPFVVCKHFGIRTVSLMCSCFVGAIISSDTEVMIGPRHRHLSRTSTRLGNMHCMSSLSLEHNHNVGESLHLLFHNHKANSLTVARLLLGQKSSSSSRSRSK